MPNSLEQLFPKTVLENFTGVKSHQSILPYTFNFRISKTKGEKSNPSDETNKTCEGVHFRGWKPLTIITKHSILDVAAALDPPLHFLETCFVLIKTPINCALQG